MLGSANMIRCETGIPQFRHALTGRAGDWKIGIKQNVIGQYTQCVTGSRTARKTEHYYTLSVGQNWAEDRWPVHLLTSW
jgi:hypothetical protein